MQLLTLRNRLEWRGGRQAPAIAYDAALTKEFVSSLPWSLTEDQRRAAHQILTDLTSPVPMMRLLQGDVGSGKTAVAAIAAHQAARAGIQTALMAPTEVLARQHGQTLTAWFAPFGIKVATLLGSDSAETKRQTGAQIASGEVSIVVGTHALIQESVAWHRLGLAIVDEQHRFGVSQREALKGSLTPHLLTMTATPIPRSLALVAYGDQDLSVIVSKPAGRQPVTTRLVPPNERTTAFHAVASQLAAGHQAFVVYPVIEASEAGLRDATTEHQRLQSGALKGWRVGLLHGRLPAAKKEGVVASFVAGELDVLVATTVIEVGVDVPNATVMLIEEAQQFGLAQLHQLRGRVGRGAAESVCYLLAGDISAEDNERLQAMTESDSGFVLAEVDLKLRGPGDLIGTKQSGFDVSIAALSDPGLLEETRTAAETLLEESPDLQKYPAIAERVMERQLIT